MSMKEKNVLIFLIIVFGILILTQTNVLNVFSNINQEQRELNCDSISDCESYLKSKGATDERISEIDIKCNNNFCYVNVPKNETRVID